MPIPIPISTNKSPVDTKLTQEALQAPHIYTIGHKGKYIAAIKDTLYAIYENQDKLKGKPSPLSMEIDDPDNLHALIKGHREQHSKYIESKDYPSEYQTATVNLVRAYQRAKGIPATGQIGDKTKASLLEDLESLQKQHLITDRQIEKKGIENQKLMSDGGRKIAFEGLNIPTLANVSLSRDDAPQNLPRKPSEEIQIT